MLHTEFKAREVPRDFVKEQRLIVRDTVPVQPRMKRQKQPVLLGGRIDLARFVAHNIELLICRVELYAPEAEIGYSVDLPRDIAGIKIYSSEADERIVVLYCAREPAYAVAGHVIFFILRWERREADRPLYRALIHELLSESIPQPGLASSGKTWAWFANI